MGRRPGDRDPRGRLRDGPSRIRARNTALVQLALAAATLVVGVLVGVVDWANDANIGRFIGAVVVSGVVAIWMFRRGRRGLQAFAP